MATTQEIRSDPKAERLMRLATYAAVATALVLIAVKLVAYMLTDSVSLLSSLMDSVLDAMASLVNLVAVRQALVPPDREHRFGHGKAEPLAGLAQAAFISGSALFLAVEAGHRLFAPRLVTHVDIGIAVSVFAIVATFILTRFQLYVVKRTGSIAIEADSLHYLGDLLINGAVIVALILAVHVGWIYADALFGLAIALYLIFNAVKIARAALDMLMDRELPEEDRRRIKEIVMSHGEVLDMHDLRTRTSGRQCFIQLHLELDGDMPLFDAHQIADTVEAALMEAFPQAEVLIHQDPHGLEEPPVHQVS